MAISQKDLKLLWGRAASRCSLCQIVLCEDKSAASDSFPFGEQAHIVAEEDAGPRGRSILTPEERNGYHNLMLLCPTDHTRIDKNPEDFPVEKLHMLKASHQLWVERTLAEGQYSNDSAENQIFADLIDSAVTLALLSKWNLWTGWALATDPRWPVNLVNSVADFRLKVLRSVWPERFPHLRASLIHLSITLDEAAQTFMRHAEEVDDQYLCIRFYRFAPNEKKYHEEVDQFNEWLRRCQELLFESTRAANWFADLVRKHINPMFFAIEGRFTITYGPLSDPPLAYRTMVLEHSLAERIELVSRYAAQR